ncbi:MAG TPA: ABC transporter permease [Actinomycetota bacterium]|jgi:putative ABC transport system permease protein|nr:ABC transporter permease [Actinomycetota bacterium]
MSATRQRRRSRSQAGRQALPPSRLLPLDILRVGSVGLRTRRLRAALSALGIAIGIAAIVGVLGISESSRADLLTQLDALGTNLLSVRAGQTLGGGAAKLPNESEALVRRIGPVEDVSSVATVSATVLRNDHVDKDATGGISVKAARLDLLSVLHGSVAQGQFLTAATERYPVVVLGSVAAKRLGITTLHGETHGETAVWLGGKWFTVVGILDPLPLAPDIDRSALIGYPQAKTAFPPSGYSSDNDVAPSTVYARTDPDQVQAVHDVLAATADPEHPEEVQVSQPSDALTARAAAKSAFDSLFLGLGAVALLVGGVGIANVMVISVLERRSEVGLRRALGATKAHVRAQFLTESLLLAALGGLGGVAIGAAVTAGYAANRGWQVVIPASSVAAGMGAALLIGAVAGLYPAVRAARLAPTEALRSV